MKRRRADIRQRRTLNLVYRIIVGIVGALVVVAGIVAIPYPGPGWLVVFAGLGILASEFSWARRLLRFVKTRYDRFMAWFRDQGPVVKTAGALLTCAVVLATLWALGTFGMVGGWLGFHQSWLSSPLF